MQFITEKVARYWRQQKCQEETDDNKYRIEGLRSSEAKLGSRLRPPSPQYTVEPVELEELEDGRPEPNLLKGVLTMCFFPSSLVVLSRCIPLAFSFRTPCLNAT
jgi:hypothetical protein